MQSDSHIGGLRTIFAEALERPSPTDRAAYLDSACDGDHKDVEAHSYNNCTPP